MGIVTPSICAGRSMLRPYKKSLDPKLSLLLGGEAEDVSGVG
jgi:hypothetical protein